MLDVAAIDVDPDSYLTSIGEVFTTFDAQDSGNVSYGVRHGGRRFFVIHCSHSRRDCFVLRSATPDKSFDSSMNGSLSPTRFGH